MDDFLHKRLYPVLLAVAMVGLAYLSGNPGPDAALAYSGDVLRWGALMLCFMFVFGWCAGYLAFAMAEVGDRFDGAMLIAYLAGAAAMIQPLHCLAG